MNDNLFAGANLRLARHFANLKQAQLGDLVAASRQFIHQLETGAKKPTREMQDALAEALQVYPWFFNRSIDEIRSDQCHFRKRQMTAESVKHQVLAHGTLFDVLVTYLGSKLELPRVHFPQFDVTTVDDIEKAAEGCREHWGLTVDQPILNVTRVVERAGAVVATFDSISASVDALSIDRARPMIVRSTAKPSPTRLRFDIAHECGHLVMHQGVCTGDYGTEAQADYFAAAFLLPRRAFVRQFPQEKRLNWRRIFALKRQWKVSVQAIIRRAYDLRVIDAIQYRTANIYIQKNGYKKKEPFEPEEMESPEIVRLALNQLQKHLGIGVDGLARELGVKPQVLIVLLGSEPLRQEEKRVVDIDEYRSRKARAKENSEEG